MFIGLLLIVVAAVLVVAMLLNWGTPSSIDLGFTTVHTNVAVIFLLGAATTLIFVMGLELIRRSAGKSIRRRREVRELSRRNKQLARERDHAVTERDTLRDPGTNEPGTNEPRTSDDPTTRS